MPDGQQDQFMLIDTIQNYIRSLAEWYNPLAKLWWQFLNWSPKLRLASQNPYPASDRLNRTPRRIRIRRCQEIAEPADIEQSRPRPP